MTLNLLAKCNNCGNIETITIEHVIDTIDHAKAKGRTLSDITYRCGECHAGDAAKAMERIFS